MLEIYLIIILNMFKLTLNICLNCLLWKSKKIILQEGMDALELKSEHMETVLNLYRPSLPHNLSQYML